MIKMREEMKKIFAIFAFFALAGMVSCSEDFNNDTDHQSVVYELGLEADATRVSYEGTYTDANNQLRHDYDWVGGDQIMVWWSPLASTYAADNYNFINTPFGANVRADGSTVFYMSGEELTNMTTDNQHYIAMYPYNNKIEGDIVTYTIGAAESDGTGYRQSQKFEGAYQVLRAEGDGVTMIGKRPLLSYEQMMTTLQFYVVEGSADEKKNSDFTNINITEMEVHFPTNVVGDVKFNWVTGAYVSASNSNAIVDVVDIKGAADKETAREAGYMSHIVTAPFTLPAYVETNPAETRIAVTVKGTGVDEYGSTHKIEQTVFKTVSKDTKFNAGDVRALYLTLTHNWVLTDSMVLPKNASQSHLAMSGTNVSTNGWNSSVHMFHSYTDANGTAVCLDNRWGIRSDISDIYAQRHSHSDLAMPTSNLEGFNRTSTLIINFDAYVVYGEGDQYCTMHIATSDDPSGTWGATSKVQSIALKNSETAPTLYKQANRTGEAALPTSGWVNYTMVLQDVSVGSYVGFRVDGTEGSLGSAWDDFWGGEAVQRTVWLKNIRFAYEKTN